MLLREIPLGFVVHLTSGDINCRIFVDINTNSLEIIVSPKDLEEAKELFTVLYNWADKHTHTAVQIFFKLLSERKWYVLVPYSAVIFYLFVQAQDQATEILREKAISLLKRGITQSNIVEAVETLLRIETQSVTAQPIQTPNWFWISVFGLVYLILILFLQPKVILGIGKGAKYIKLWNGWQRLILITIPPFIIGLLLTFFGEKVLQTLFP
jgi:hypothetical protein